MDIAIISFANYIAWMQGIGSTSENLLPELDPNVSKSLAIEKLDLELLLQQVDQEMQETLVPDRCFQKKRHSPFFVTRKKLH